MANASSGIATESGKTFAAKMFIDATYEGDLMAAAGVTYTVGREANKQYGETLNGVAAASRTSPPPVHREGRSLRQARRPEERPALRHRARPPRQDGEGDKRVQAYSFRMCMTDVPANRVPFAKPGGLRREAVRTAVPQLRGRRSAHSDEARPDAQPQDRHEQQLRLLHRQHRPELRLPGGELRRARRRSSRSTSPTRRG